MEPDNENYLFDVAEFLAYHEAAAQLVEIFRIAIKRMPDSPRVEYGLAVTYMEQNRATEAVELLEKLQTKHPNFEPAYMALGECYNYLGRVEELLTLGKRLQGLNPANPNGWYFVGAAYLRVVREGQGSSEDAVAALKRSVSLDRNSARTHFDLARAYEAGGNYGLAEAELKETLRLEPQHPNARYVLGQLYQRQGKTELASGS
jgi:predicted Zn-dependent protease